MAKPIETLSPTDEAIFRTATLKSLQGAAEDPEHIGAEYMPDTIEPDYITLTDQSGETIPANSLGRKGSTPYFGNSPLVNGATVAIVESMFTTASPTRVELAELAIAAESMVVGSQYNLVADIYIDFQTDAPSAQDVFIQIDLSGQADFTSSEGFLIPLSASRLQKLRIEGVVELVDSAGDIALSMTQVRGLLLNSAYGAAVNATMTGKILEPAVDIVETAMITETPSIANSIKIWAFNLTLATGKTIEYRGTVSLSSI
jgi:hypothetical protein